LATQFSVLVITFIAILVWSVWRGDC